MKLGTAEPLLDPESPRIVRSRVRSGGGSNTSSGNNGGNGDDGGNFGGFETPSSETGNGDKAKVLTWFLLLVVGMTFAGLVGAYVMVSANHHAEWKPFRLPIEVWISTFLIIASSFSYHIAKRAIEADNIEAGRRWLVVTTVLGASFISSQLMAWLVLTQRGLYMQGNPFVGFFYILTSVHVVHVLGGIIALGSIIISVWNGGGSEFDRLKRRKLARAVGWYWDFIGVIWIILFVLLGFWQ